jgi:hypothetical protein
MTKELHTYVTKSAGWVGGKIYPQGASLQLTKAAAKYENVSPASDEAPDIEMTGSLDDPLVKSTGLAAPGVAEKTKRAARKQAAK